jgi:sporulation protein YlmC with PRC-barrel domain
MAARPEISREPSRFPSRSPDEVAPRRQRAPKPLRHRVIQGNHSAKRQILGQSVYNDKGEAIGKADDIIIAPDKAVSYAIIGAGGFLGVGKHDVAIPVSQLKQSDGKIVLAGATKEVIKAMPPFEYAR